LISSDAALGDFGVEFFRRYTNLAATIHILRNKTVSLVNPATWDDKNDAYFMAEYKRIVGAKSVLALCFAECGETYHHWRVFCQGVDGVCIELNKENLLSSFRQDKFIKHGYVKYELIKNVRARKSFMPEELPFLKRRPFEDEREYRIIYNDPNENHEFKDYKVKISWISRITLNPWIPKTLYLSIKDTLKSIDGCSGLSIAKSTLVDNVEWKKVTTRVQRGVYPPAAINGAGNRQKPKAQSKSPKSERSKLRKLSTPAPKRQ
jgi:hypothetical protein